ncbi:unnamed protein product [Gadus morhua 'NCC']
MCRAETETCSGFSPSPPDLLKRHSCSLIYLRRDKSQVLRDGASARRGVELQPRFVAFHPACVRFVSF